MFTNFNRGDVISEHLSDAKLQYLTSKKKKEVYTSTVKGSEYVQPINMTWLYVNYTLILKYIIKKNALAHKDLWQ